MEEERPVAGDVLSHDFTERYRRYGGLGTARALPRWRFFWSAMDIAALVVGISAGVLGLAGVPEGTGSVILRIVATASLLVVVIRLWNAYFAQRTSYLAHAVADLQSSKQEYIDAIVRTVNRETPLFEDKLDITIYIGQADDGDRIVEKWHTTPKPRLTHKAYRPIIPTDDDRVARLTDIDYSCSIDEPFGEIAALPLIERSRYLLVWLVFDPAQRQPVEWIAAYRPRGLWRNLRQKGRDQLGWQDQMPSGTGNGSSLTDLAIRFVFPPSVRPPIVTEIHGSGRTSSAELLTGGEWLIVWRDPNPTGRNYNWELTRSSED